MRPTLLIIGLCLPLLVGCDAILGDFTAGVADGGDAGGQGDGSPENIDAKRHDGASGKEAGRKDARDTGASDTGRDTGKASDAHHDTISPRETGADVAPIGDSGQEAGTDGGGGDAGNPADAGMGLVGQACTPDGAAACNGNASEQVLLCNGGTWTVGTTCMSSERCDTTTSACAPVVTGCVKPAMLICSNNQLLECGLDLVSSTVEEACGPHQTCTITGTSGSCVCNTDPVCTKGGPTGPTCDANGTHVITCAVDSDNCPSESGSTDCTNGDCYGSAGSAQCCTNECSGFAKGCDPTNTMVENCDVDPTTHCTVQTEFSCVDNSYGDVCNSGMCSCVVDGDCATADGHICVSLGTGRSECGCNVESDCSSFCCSAAAPGATGGPGFCVSQAGEYMCVAGVWQAG